MPRAHRALAANGGISCLLLVGGPAWCYATRPDGHADRTLEASWRRQRVVNERFDYPIGLPQATEHGERLLAFFDNRHEGYSVVRCYRL